MALLDQSVVSLLKSTYPALEIPLHAEIKNLSGVIFPEIEYSDSELVRVGEWLKHAENVGSVDSLSEINKLLSTITTALGNKPSVADYILYSKIAPLVSSWSSEERTGANGYHHIVRYADFVQNSPIFTMQPQVKISIDADDVRLAVKPIDSKPKKGPAMKEKGDGSTKPDGDKGAKKISGKEKKTEKNKERQLSPCLIDLRVGKIIKAVNHPNADSLFVSSIACGDAPGTEHTSECDGQVVRNVCSGLNGLVPLEDMQGRRIVAVCNLKPVNMRGVQSAAMVLAASPKTAADAKDAHKGPVELVDPPAAAKVGDRLFFDGWSGDPERLLNPKKKVWETIQPGFTTTDDLEVSFDASFVPQLSAEPGSAAGKLGKLKTLNGGICSVKSLKGASVR